MFFSGASARSLLSKADTARDSRDWGLAATLYQKYLARKPNAQPIWVQLGHARKENGDYSGAKVAYERALSLDPESADTHLQMGHFVKITGDIGRAVACYRRAYELDPRLEAASIELTALGETLERQPPDLQTLPLKEQIFRIAQNVTQIESTIAPVFRSMNEFLSQSSSLKSLGFEIASLRRELNFKSSDIDTRLSSFEDSISDLTRTNLSRNDHCERLKYLENNQKILLNFISETRAMAFAISQIKNDLDQNRNFGDTVNANSNDIATLASRLDSIEELQLHNANGANSRLTDISNQLRAQAAAMAERASADVSAVRAEALRASAQLSGRLDQLQATRMPPKSEDLAIILGQPEAVVALGQALSGHFAATEALVVQNRRIAKIEANLAGLQAQAPNISLTELREELEQARLRAEQIAAQAANAATAQTQTREMQSYLAKRIEFVRREIMFEFRHGRGDLTAAALTTSTQIVNPSKLAAQRGFLRLNLGCGHISLDQYINVDRRELPGVDIVAEIDNLPFNSGEISEIRSAHLIEHFPQEELRRSLLPYWKSLLKPGGTFLAIVPDAEAMILATNQGDYSFADFREVFFGAQDYDGDYHYNMFTPESLRDLLIESGFESVVIIEQGRRNGACFEFQITAQAPAR